MNYLKSLIWMVRKFGVRRVWTYELERKRREYLLDRKFDPKVDGEPLARALGYDDDVIKKLKEAGLA